MLDRLVASCPEHRAARTVPGAILSLLVHGGVLSAAVLATLPPPRLHVRGEIMLAESLVYRVPTTGPRRTGTRGRLGRVPQIDQGFRIGVEPPQVPLPDLDPLGPPDGGPGGTGLTGTDRDAGYPFGVGPGGQEGAGTVYHARTVEQPPLLLTRPPLVYPPRLREAGIEGCVLVEVVVDSLGVPEPASLRVVGASHPGFIPAARDVALAARFRPGQAWGRPVRVLIRQPIVFRIAREGGRDASPRCAQ